MSNKTLQIILIALLVLIFGYGTYRYGHHEGYSAGLKYKRSIENFQREAIFCGVAEYYEGCDSEFFFRFKARK